MKRKFCIFLVLVLSAIIFVSSFILITGILRDKEEEYLFEIIAEHIEEEQPNVENRLAELKKQNCDFAAWLSIPDTNIDYPVMQTPNNQDYYLYKNFNKEYSRYGTPYLQANCNISSSDNLIVYGHNMRTKAMFHDLTLYKDISFYKEHRLIYFDTPESEQTYEIIAVFKTVAYSNEAFEYNTFVSASDEQEYREYVKKCKSLSLYDTGLSAEYGEQLLTLSTCEYSQTNGRIVVVAKKV